MDQRKSPSLSIAAALTERGCQLTRPTPDVLVVSDPTSRQSVSDLRFTDGQGNVRALDAERGKVVVLACWTHWPHDPSFVGLCNWVAQSAAARAGGVKVGAVNLGYHTRYAGQYDQGRDPAVESWSLTDPSDLPRLGLVNVPSVVVIDRHGRIGVVQEFRENAPLTAFV